MGYWERDVAYLRGVGPKRATLLREALEVHTFKDLAMLFPRKYVDRSQVTKIKDVTYLNEGQFVTLVGKLGKFDAPPGGKVTRLVSTLRDETGWAELTWFQGARYVASKFKEGEEVVIFGRVGFFQQKLQFTHPEIESLRDGEDTLDALKIVPFYSSTEALKKQGLDARGLRRLTHALIAGADEPFPEILTPEILTEYRLPNRPFALANIHFPQDFPQLEQAKRRFKFEEFFFFELIMARRKTFLQPQRGARPFTRVGELFNEFYANHLPFTLTGAQKRVVKEIRHDLAKPIQMNRLVQGDVGSGKTMVAVLAMLLALDNGYQALLMAPTEILAEQHFHNIYRYLSPLNVSIELVVGAQRKKLRNSIIYNLVTGTSKIAVGTHALLEESIQFQNLGLTIIDEQHKFGVLQRARLWSKAPVYPHNLAMTATPIPRTLGLTLYGDVDLSIIDELPPGRKPVKTVVKSQANRLEVNGFVAKQLALGRQIYIVYPLVEESAKLDLAAVTEGYESTCRAFPNARVGIVHGKMKPDAKEFEMQRFKKGETHILVSTTVIEVGVDVPNASVMVIENAERFGLSQLHQLRGRVGRGAEQSFTILVASHKLSKEARRRLDAMTMTNDGFKISEIDLEIRGPGDFMGTRQSGLPEFRIANIATDGAILEQAKTAAFDLARRDALLQAPECAALKAFFEAYVAQHNLQDLIA